MTVKQIKTPKLPSTVVREPFLMMMDLDKSCLTTHSWKKIEERL